MAVDTIDDRLETINDRLAASPSSRDRILRAAATLLDAGGRAAVTTRAVSAAAGVQPPTIYRQFGDMQGLLDAVAADGFARYVRTKVTRENTTDPVADLRAGWEAHIGFGLANPALYALMYGDPRLGDTPPAAIEAAALLHELVQRVAEVGRLRVDVDRATRMIHAAGVGVVLTLSVAAVAERDHAVSELTREAILAAVTTEPSSNSASEPGRLGPARPGPPATLSPSKPCSSRRWPCSRLPSGACSRSGSADSTGSAEAGRRRPSWAPSTIGIGWRLGGVATAQGLSYKPVPMIVRPPLNGSISAELIGHMSSKQERSHDMTLSSALAHI